MFDDREDWDVEIEPKYKTDRKKYISVVVSRGPNNQLISLRESLFVAIRLNRSYIIPPFFKHGLGDPTAKGEADIIPTYLRVDTHRIRQLIHTRNPSDVKSACPSVGFDAFYVVSALCKEEGLTRLKRTCSYLNLTCHSENGHFIGGEQCTNIPIPIFPSDEMKVNENPGSSPTDKITTKFVRNLTRIEGYYSTDHICPVIVYPYQMVNFWHHLNLYSMGKITDDNQIMKDIVIHTPRPSFLQNFVDQFLTRLGGPFLAIHWRYDAEDWVKEQCSNNTPQRSFICQNPSIMTSADELATFIIKYIKKAQTEAEFDFMYIASPPAQVELLENVRELVTLAMPTFHIYLQSEV